MNLSETQYAMNGDLGVAYRTLGEGPRDVLVMPNWFSNVEGWWEIPEFVRWFEEIGTFTRCVFFDQPGTGVSDPISFDNPPSLEQWVDSARVVLDAAGSSEAAVVAVDGAFPTAALFAATYPARTSALVGFDAWARIAIDEDFEFGFDSETLEQLLTGIEGLWGTGETQHTLNWDMPWNEEVRATWARHRGAGRTDGRRGGRFADRWSCWRRGPRATAACRLPHRRRRSFRRRRCRTGGRRPC